MSGEGVHQVALVSGMCTAGGAYTPTMCDEAVMVHKIANIYLGGPPLVKERNNLRHIMRLRKQSN
jgi:3-methylcrotonyl-CoA carboxylase beta subunit